MDSTLFTEYFHKNLSGNPYYGEIMELLKQQDSTTLSHSVTAASGGGGGDVSGQQVSEQELNEQIQQVEVGDYRISTMTCIYDFGVEIDEYKIYDLADKILRQTQDSFDKKDKLFYVEGVECFDKPIIGKQIQKKRGKLSTRKFRNQITLIIWAETAKKHIKVKLFRTGRAQMTGVTSETSGENCVRFLASIMNTNADYLGIKEEVVWNDSNMTIAMMNGDLSVGHTVSREILNSVVCRKYGITSNLDADTYPGVIMKYTIGDKQITISVFASGKVIITGANARSQIETCGKLVRFLCSKL